MEPTSYDILRREKSRAAIWLEASADLTSARFRIKQIISFWPGTYEVVERESQRIAAAAGGGARLRVPLRRTREYARKRFGRAASGGVPRWLASMVTDRGNQRNQAHPVMSSYELAHQGRATE